MSLFDPIWPVIQICQLSGLAPFSMNQTTLKWESNPALKILSIILICCMCSILLNTIIFNDYFIDYSLASNRVVLFNLFLFLNHLHAFSVLVELFKNRNQQINLLNMFEDIDFSLRQHLNMNVDYGKLKASIRQIIIVWMCEVAALLISDILLLIQIQDKYHLRYFSVFIPPYILCKLSYAYSMTLVTIGQENIDVLSKYLRSVSKQNGYYISDTISHRKDSNCNKRKWNINESKMNINLKTLLFMKEIYSKIWEAFRSVQNLMYWSYPIGLSNGLFVLIFNVYLLTFNIFVYNRATFLYLFFVLHIASDLINMLLIAKICSKVVKSVS